MYAFDSLIEPTAVTVESLLLIFHLDSHLEASLELFIEVDEVRIDVIKQSAIWSQTQRHGQSAAERFDIASGRVRSPDSLKLRE